MTDQIDIFSIVDREGWELTPEKELRFSGDQVIDAYLKGKEEGEKLNNKLVLSKVLENLKASYKLAAHLFSNLEDRGLHPSYAYLRLSDAANFDFLITVPEEEFLDDRILDAYRVIEETEMNSRENDTFFTPRISMCAVGDHFNKKSLAVDGYILRAQNKTHEEGARRA